MTLALYLIPALWVVLVVGGMGMLVLAIGRLFTGPIHLQPVSLNISVWQDERQSLRSNEARSLDRPWAD